MKMNTGEQMRMISEALKQDQRNYLHEVMQGQARIAELEAELAALKAKAAVPDGWRLVPEMLTPEMEKAVNMGYGKLGAVWRLLLAAAPAQPGSAKGGE